MSTAGLGVSVRHSWVSSDDDDKIQRTGEAGTEKGQV